MTFPLDKVPAYGKKCSVPNAALYAHNMKEGLSMNSSTVFEGVQEVVVGVLGASVAAVTKNFCSLGDWSYTFILVVL